MFRIILGLFMMVMWHQADYAEYNNWSHRTVDGLNSGSRAIEVDLEDEGIAEIMYRGRCDLSRAVEMWEESPGHANVMHDEKYNHMVAIMVPDPYKEGRCVLIVNYAQIR